MRRPEQIGLHKISRGNGFGISFAHKRVSTNGMKTRIAGQFGLLEKQSHKKAGPNPWSAAHDSHDIHGIFDLEGQTLTMKRKARAMRAMPSLCYDKECRCGS